MSWDVNLNKGNSYYQDQTYRNDKVQQLSYTIYATCLTGYSNVYCFDMFSQTNLSVSVSQTRKDGTCPLNGKNYFYERSWSKDHTFLHQFDIPLIF